MEVNKQEKNGFEDVKKETEGSAFRKLLAIILWVVVLGWVAVVGIDYYRSVKEKEPLFCIMENTKSFENGTIYECVGPGYKYYSYNLETIKGSKFGGFWIDDSYE